MSGHKFTMFGHFIVASEISVPTRLFMRQTDNFTAKFIPQSPNNFGDIGTQIHDVSSFYYRCVGPDFRCKAASLYINSQTDNFTAKFISQSPNKFSDVGSQIYYHVGSFYCCVENPIRYRTRNYTAYFISLSPNNVSDVATQIYDV